MLSDRLLFLVWAPEQEELHWEAQEAFSSATAMVLAPEHEDAHCEAQDDFSFATAMTWASPLSQEDSQEEEHSDLAATSWVIAPRAQQEPGSELEASTTSAAGLSQELAHELEQVPGSPALDAAMTVAVALSPEQELPQAPEMQSPVIMV